VTLKSIAFGFVANSTSSNLLRHPFLVDLPPVQMIDLP